MTTSQEPYRYVPPEQQQPLQQQRLQQQPLQQFDPLRLCIFATVALITWLVGPLAVAFFAGLGLAGYVRARRAGLTRSRCLLRDVRLVMAYLAVLVLVGAGAAVWSFVR